MVDDLNEEARQPFNEQELESLLRAAPKRRGRPPGSKNKPKVDDQGNYVPPASRRSGTSKEPTDEENKARKIADKKRLADKRTKQIAEELNDGWLSMLIMTGIPRDAIYKPGRGPQVANADPNLTDLGAKVAIPPHLAKIWGNLVAEVESSTIGTSLTNAVEGDSPIRLLVLIAVSLGASVPWLNGLNEVRRSVNALNEANKRYQSQVPVEQRMNQGVVG